MSLDESKYRNYIKILQEELIPALGCTEPIAIAYAAATLRQIIQDETKSDIVLPEKLTVECSGNIIKNVKSVIVPNTNGMKGIEAAAVIGYIGGNKNKELEVLADVKLSDIQKALDYLSKNKVKVNLLKTPAQLHIKLIAEVDNSVYIAELIHRHTDIVLLKKDDKIIFEKPYDTNAASSALTDRSCLNVNDIIEFADSVNLNDVEPVLARQIEYNTRIAKDGLTNSYGIKLGQSILDYYKKENGSIPTRVSAKAETAAASDARMCGCSFPVVTNSGSGNQGLAVSVPVIVYAREENIDKDRLYRSLIVSNLLAIHQKTGIGRLSAYCGAVTAGAASAAGIAYMHGASYDQICGTITNTLANVSGLICDGAKQSCALKIATALDAALLSYELAMENKIFDSGDGVVKTDIEKTIKGIGRVAAEGMVKTDSVILDVMLSD